MPNNYNTKFIAIFRIIITNVYLQISLTIKLKNEIKLKIEL